MPEENLITGTEETTVEIVEVDTFDFMEKSFEEYTTSEGLLLLIFVILFLDFILNILRRWF